MLSAYAASDMTIPTSRAWSACKDLILIQLLESSILHSVEDDTLVHFVPLVDKLALFVHFDKLGLLLVVALLLQVGRADMVDMALLLLVELVDMGLVVLLAVLALGLVQVGRVDMVDMAVLLLVGKVDMALRQLVVRVDMVLVALGFVFVFGRLLKSRLVVLGRGLRQLVDMVLVVLLVRVGRVFGKVDRRLVRIGKVRIDKELLGRVLQRKVQLGMGVALS